MNSSCVRFFSTLIGVIVSFIPLAAYAEGTIERTSDDYKNLLLSRRIILKADSEKFVLNFSDHPDWIQNYPKYYFNGVEFTLPAEPPVQSASGANMNSVNSINIFPDISLSKEDILEHPDIVVENIWGFDRARITEYLLAELAPAYFVERQDVTIKKNEEGEILFEGIGKDGKVIDMEKIFILVKFAVENDLESIQIPFLVDKAQVHIGSTDLENLGLKEIIALGQSDYSGSPGNRIHNIAVGSQKLSGILIGTGGTFSIAENIGPVNARTGYRPELVIKGPKTIPEYGGGLCQVSSTIYRGAMNAGLEITKRSPHSYAVTYYMPWGTDATVYPPSVDLRFKNNTPGAILMQSYMEKNHLYFVYYGTHDGRRVEQYGPYISNRVGIPPTKIENTTALPPGAKKIVGGAHPGFRAKWYRYVTTSTGKTMISEIIESRYQARPLYILVGAEKEEAVERPAA